MKSQRPCRRTVEPGRELSPRLVVAAERVAIRDAERRGRLEEQGRRDDGLARCDLGPGLEREPDRAAVALDPQRSGRGGKHLRELRKPDDELERRDGLHRARAYSGYALSSAGTASETSSPCGSRHHVHAANTAQPAIIASSAVKWPTQTDWPIAPRTVTAHATATKVWRTRRRRNSPAPNWTAASRPNTSATIFAERAV